MTALGHPSDSVGSCGLIRDRWFEILDSDASSRFASNIALQNGISEEYQTMRGLSLTITLCALPLLTVQAGESSSDGQKLYQDFKCAACHGADGKTGAKDQVPPLAGLSADQIYTKTLEMGIVKTHESALEDCGTPPSSFEVRKIADYLASFPR